MRVTISGNGNLTLIPETPLENYALDKWYDGFTSDNGKETISVSLFVVEEEKCKVNGD